MYSFIVTFILSVFLIFIVYKFYSRIDNIVKQYLPSQRVLDIKNDMKKVNKVLEERDNVVESKVDKTEKTDSMFQKINELMFMPIEFIQKATTSILSNMGWNLGKSI
jgi:F0F1-type ATP synthase membrane subunit b/b'